MKNVTKFENSVSVPLSKRQIQKLFKLVDGRLEWLDKNGLLEVEKHGDLIAMHELLLSFMGR